METEDNPMPSDRIAVISDTHDKVPRSLVDKLSQATEIWHLGDVTRPDILIPLENLGVPLIGVRGNCDAYGNWPLSRRLERHGCTFCLQHLPPEGYPDLCDAIFFGHLHRPIDTLVGGIRALNPGAVSGPRDGSVASFAWLTFPEAGKWRWQIEAL